MWDCMRTVLLSPGGLNEVENISHAEVTHDGSVITQAAEGANMNPCTAPDGTADPDVEISDSAAVLYKIQDVCVCKAGSLRRRQPN